MILISTGPPITRWVGYCHGCNGYWLTTDEDELTVTFSGPEGYGRGCKCPRCITKRFMMHVVEPLSKGEKLYEKAVSLVALPTLTERIRSIEMTLERMEDYQREQNERTL